MMRQVSGLNELTDGSTPNAKTLVPVAESAIQSTNNAIYLVSDAEKSIILRSADAAVQKVQIAVKLGKVEGYAKALGSNTVKFFSINPNLSLHEIGIFISDALTEEQKQMLWQDINIKESQGLLDVGDKYFLNEKPKEYCNGLPNPCIQNTKEKRRTTGICITTTTGGSRRKHTSNPSGRADEATDHPITIRSRHDKDKCTRTMDIRNGNDEETN